METDPRAWIKALRATHDELVSTVTDLGPDGVTAQSYCSDWTNAQVLSHLGSGAEIALAGLEAAVAGEEQPGRDSFPAIWDRWNAKAPEDQARDALVADERHVKTLEALDEASLGALHVQNFGMDMDAAAMVGMRLGELAPHTWDVGVTLHEGLPLPPAAAPLLVDRLGLMISYFAHAAEAGVSGVLEVRTTDPTRTYRLELGEKTTLTADDKVGPVDGKLVIPAEALFRLVYGRLDPDHTPPLELDSERISLDDLRRSFPGF